MAPKKKSKSKRNKLASMSDDERSRYLQHKADIEEAKKRKKEELISKFLIMKFKKEEMFCKHNSRKLNQKWRQIMRVMKSEEMKQDIRALITTFNFTVNKKNRVISTLLKSIETADGQHRRMFQSHVEWINRFLEIGSTSFSRLNVEYEQRKTNLLVEWDRELIDISEQRDQNEYHLKLIMFQQNQTHDIYKRDWELTAMTRKNDIAIEARETLLDLQRPKELEIESYWNQIRTVYMNYVDKHKPIIDHYNMLREKDDFFKRDILYNTKKISKMTKSLSALQNKYEKTISRLELQVKSNAQQKDNIHNKIYQLKQQIKIDNQRELKRLKELVHVSENSVQRFESVIKKFKKILQLKELCSRYETKENKPRKSGLNLSHTQTEIDLDSIENIDDNMKNEIASLQRLNSFLIKVNHVKVNCTALRGEKLALTKQCEILKANIKIKLTEVVMKDTVFTYNNRPSTVGCFHDNHSITMRPTTCIEAAYSNAVQHEAREKAYKNKMKNVGIVKSYPRLPQYIQRAKS